MKITLLPGDGIGVEIVDAAVEVLDAAAKKYNFTVEYDKKLIGGAAIDAFGTPLPEETLASAKASDAVLLGAVGGPKWDNVDPSIRPEKGLLNIRKGLGLYCNLRPMKVSKYTAHLSPLKTERAEGADLLIVRELTGGIYFGTHNEAHLNADGVEEASDIEMYTRPEVERIARFAFEAARKRSGKVTSVDKANVLGSSRMWRKIVTEMRDKEYPDVELNHFYVDNCAMQLVKDPGQFDVVVTENMFGDILSDEASMITGSIGMIPSSSMGDGTNGLYEPIHGSAPDIAGQNKANPSAILMAFAMMLNDLGMTDKAARLNAAILAQVAEGKAVTADIGGTATTTEFTDAVAARL